MTVLVLKTEHHEGGESRVMPIFPELLPHLEDVYDQAPEGAEYVITRYRDVNCNLRTQLLRISQARQWCEPGPMFQETCG